MVEHWSSRSEVVGSNPTLLTEPGLRLVGIIATALRQRAAVPAAEIPSKYLLVDALSSLCARLVRRCVWKWFGRPCGGVVWWWWCFSHRSPGRGRLEAAGAQERVYVCMYSYMCGSGPPPEVTTQPHGPDRANTLKIGNQSAEPTSSYTGKQGEYTNLHGKTRVSTVRHACNGMHWQVQPQPSDTSEEGPLSTCTGASTPHSHLVCITIPYHHCNTSHNHADPLL